MACDGNGRYIVHILAGECNENIKMKLTLYRTLELEKTNLRNINQEFINFLIRLHNGKIVYDKIKLLVYDQAPYAL